MPTAKHFFSEALIHSVKNKHNLGKRAPFQSPPLPRPPQLDQLNCKQEAFEIIYVELFYFYFS